MAETRDYTLGKGKVLFKKDGTDHFADLGNAPAFNLNVTVDKLEHFSSRSGLSKKDLEVITKLTMGGSFTLDEPNAQNCAMFVMSTGSAVTTQAVESTGTDVSGEGDTAGNITCHSLGSWQPLYQVSSVITAGEIAEDASNTGAHTGANAPTIAPGTGDYDNTVTEVYDFMIATAAGTDQITWRQDGGAWSAPTDITGAAQAFGSSDLEITFALTTGGVLYDKWTVTLTATPSATQRVYDLKGTPTVTNVGASVTYVEGIEGTGNYQIDYSSGMIYFNLDQDSPANAIAEDQVVKIADAMWEPKDGSLDSNSAVSDKIITTLGGTLTTLKGDIYFVGDPPQGRIVDIRGNCSLTPNGDWGLIGEDWMQYTFDIEFLEVPGNTQVIDVIDRGKVG